MHFKNRHVKKSLISNGKRWVILLTLPCLLLSCNMNGYNDLGELVSQFTQFGTETITFMRTLDLESGSGTECFTINGAYKKGQCSFMRVLADEQEVTVTLQLGSYEIFNDQIELFYFQKYSNTYKRKPNPAEVPGATQQDLSPQEHVQTDWLRDAAIGTIEIGDVSYKQLDRIFNSIFSQASPNWVDQFIKMYLLNTMSAHARIEGFGGGGMFQYLDKTTIFDALRFGTMNFTVTGLLTVNSRFAYKNHGELSGVTLNGTMTNKSDMNGNGEMGGAVSFTIQGTENTWHGSVDYSHLNITNTLPFSGEYLITIEGQNYTASYDFGNPGNFDLTDIVDPDPANW